MNLHDRPLIEQMAVAYATEIERLRAALEGSDYDILLLRVEHQDAEIARLRAALEEIASARYQCGHGCADYARKALAKEEGK